MSKFVSAILCELLFCLSFATQATQAQTWISNVYSSITNSTATITWTTAVPTTTQVQYGLTTSYGTHTTLNSTLVASHSATLTGLTAGTLYHVRLLNRDSEPLQLASIDYTITTQSAPVTVAISPAMATIASGGTLQLTAQVSNATNTAVTWTASSGSVNASGLFTAPSVTGTVQVTVTATSQADPTKSATAVITVTAPVQHSVSLSWQPSTSNNIASYNAYRSLTQGGPYSQLASSITGVAYSDGAVQAGTTYYYVVTATNTSGEESADSAEVSATVPTP